MRPNRRPGFRARSKAGLRRSDRCTTNDFPFWLRRCGAGPPHSLKAVPLLGSGQAGSHIGAGREEAGPRFHLYLKTPFRPADLLTVVFFEEEYVETRTWILSRAFSRMSCFKGLFYRSGDVYSRWRMAGGPKAAPAGQDGSHG
jgi:hypothetical protein